MSDPIGDLLSQRAQGAPAQSDPVGAMLMQHAQAQATPAAAAPVAQAPQRSFWQNVINAPGDALTAAAYNIQKPFHGAAQLVEHGIDAGLQAVAPNSGAANYWHGVVKSDDAGMKQTEDAYQQAVPDNAASYAGAATGAAMNPLNRVMGTGAGYLSTLLRGGAQGALSGLLTPDVSGGDNFAATKAKQAAAGAVVGGVAAPVAKLAVDKVVAPAVNKASTLAAALRGTPAAVPAADLSAAAQSAGIDPASVQPDLWSSVQAQAAQAQATGAQLDMGAALRKAKFQSVGVDPLLGQITRDPTQFTQELNIRGLPGGEPIANTLQAQNQQLVKALASQTGNAATPYGAGQSVMGKLVADDATRKAAVDSAYAAVRDSQGRAMPLDHVGFVNAANDALDTQMAGTSLPSNIRDTLNNIALGKIPFNANNAIQFDHILSLAQRGGTPEAAYSVGLVRNALQDAKPSSGAAADTIDLYNTARNLARDRFQTIEANPGLKAALNDAPPEDFVGKYVINGKVNDVKNLMTLSGDQGNTIKQQVLSYLQDKATNGAPLENANFSYAGYKKALNGIAPEKLNAIFSPDEVNTLINLRDVAGYIQSPPAGSSVNTSNSGSAVGQLVSKLAKLPYVKEYVAAPLKNMQTGAAANAATAAQVPTTPSPGQAALVNFLRRGAVIPAVAAAQKVDDR